MKFRVLLHRRASEFLKRLKPEDKRRIVDKLRQLEDFPAVRLDIVKKGSDRMIVVKNT